MALTTAPSIAVGRDLVRKLVAARLVACGTIVPGAESIYRFENRIHEAPEVLVILKTTVGCWPALKETLPRLHPYDVPELIVVPITGGHTPYLDWVSAETGNGSVETA